MNEELNNFMATKVMEWNNDNGEFWEDEKGYFKYYFTYERSVIYEGKYWHPATDTGQAIICATKYCDDNICVLSTQYDPTRKLWWADITDGNDGIDGESNKDNLSLAICEAIKQAVEK